MNKDRIHAQSHKMMETALTFKNNDELKVTGDQS